MRKITPILWVLAIWAVVGAIWFAGSWHPLKAAKPTAAVQKCFECPDAHTLACNGGKVVSDLSDCPEYARANSTQVPSGEPTPFIDCGDGATVASDPKYCPHPKLHRRKKVAKGWPDYRNYASGYFPDEGYTSWGDSSVVCDPTKLPKGDHCSSETHLICGSTDCRGDWGIGYVGIPIELKAGTKGDDEKAVQAAPHLPPVPDLALGIGVVTTVDQPCGWAANYDKDKNRCVIKMIFDELPPVSCGALFVDADTKHQTLICSYAAPEKNLISPTPTKQ